MAFGQGLPPGAEQALQAAMQRRNLGQAGAMQGATPGSPTFQAMPSQPPMGGASAMPQGMGGNAPPPPPSMGNAMGPQSVPDNDKRLILKALITQLKMEGQKEMPPSPPDLRINA